MRAIHIIDFRDVVGITKLKCRVLGGRPCRNRETILIKQFWTK
jgi:hypothetical protein